MDRTPLAIRIARIGKLSAFAIFALSFLAVVALDDAARLQPTVQTQEFNHPHKVKGTTRYISGDQYRMLGSYNLAELASGVVGCCLIGLIQSLENKRRWLERQNELDAISQRLDEHLIARKV